MHNMHSIQTILWFYPHPGHPWLSLTSARLKGAPFLAMYRVNPTVPAGKTSKERLRLINFV
jgi:hypothetical protein